MPQKRILLFFLMPTKPIPVLTFFLTDKFLLQNIQRSEIYNITWSDHTLVSITVGEGGLGTRANRGRNNAVLMARPEHKHQIQQALQEFFDLNASSTEDPFTLWNTHKAFIRGILVQQSSRARRLRTQRLNDTLTSIKHLGQSHKQNPLPHTLTQLNQARLDLRNILLSQHHTQVKSLKANFYIHGNKAGKLLAHQLRDRTFKQKLPYLYPPTQVRNY